jgi:hypothetical protein
VTDIGRAIDDAQLALIKCAKGQPRQARGCERMVPAPTPFLTESWRPSPRLSVLRRSSAMLLSVHSVCSAMSGSTFVALLAGT